MHLFFLYLFLFNLFLWHLSLLVLFQCVSYFYFLIFIISISSIHKCQMCSHVHITSCSLLVSLVYLPSAFISILLTLLYMYLLQLLLKFRFPYSLEFCERSIFLAILVLVSFGFCLIFCSFLIIISHLHRLLSWLSMRNK